MDRASSPNHPEMASLLCRIDAFLKLSRLSPSYFGRRAVGNTEVVKRLRKGGEVKRRTERLINDFISTEIERRNISPKAFDQALRDAKEKSEARK